MNSLAGVGELLNENSIYVYPNPSNGRFRVGSFVAQLDELQIQNGLGELVGAVSSPSKAPGLSIDISSQPDGIYFLRIRAGDSFLTKKIVLQR
jgi:hypothetical protein